MNGYFKRIWGKMGIDMIALIRKGVFLMRFASLESCLTVNNEGFHFFDNKSLITKLWEPDVILDKNDVQSVPTWIKLPGLALKY